MPHVELDALHWGPNWSVPTDEDFRARVAEALTTPGWVVDGSYHGKLGDSAWNLFGVSYSTRVMLDAAAADPQGVRSVVLDSFLPEQVGWYDDFDANLVATMARLGVRDRFEAVAEYRVPVTRELEDAEIKNAAVWRLRA